MTHHRLLTLGLSLVLGPAVIAGCGGGDEGGDEQAPGAAKQTTLRIGIAGDFSGPFAEFDRGVRDGMEFAAKVINAGGGSDGITVEIVAKDGKGDPTGHVTAAQELIDEGVLVSVLGHGNHIGAGQLIAGAGGIMGSGMHTTPSILTDIGDRIFGIVFNDPMQAAADAQYACDNGYRTAAVLGSPEFDYLKWMPVYFKEAFEKICGGKTVAEDSYKLATTDFGVQVTKIKNLSPPPDVIFSPLFVPQTGAFLKQLRAAGVTIPFLGGDGNDSKFFPKSAGNAADGVVYAAHGAAEPGSPMEKFYEEFEEVMGKPVETFSFEAVGRDHVYAFVEAAKQAGSVEPDALLDAAIHLKNVPLISGEIAAMNPETRWPDKPVFLVKMVGTERTFEKVQEPTYVPDAR